MLKRQHIPLILGFAIPVLMVLFVVVSIYVPGMFIHPKYDFLYSTDGNYYNGQTYSVVDHKLVKNVIPTPAYPDSMPHSDPQLYIHHIESNTSTAVSFEDAGKIKLDSTSESPDGFKLEDGSRSGGVFPFSWSEREYNTRYLVGHNMSKKQNIKTDSTDYYRSIQFLGWILP